VFRLSALNDDSWVRVNLNGHGNCPFKGGVVVHPSEIRTRGLGGSWKPPTSLSLYHGVPTGWENMVLCLIGEGLRAGRGELKGRSRRSMRPSNVELKRDNNSRFI
jgi:hypothetical protein